MPWEIWFRFLGCSNTGVSVVWWVWFEGSVSVWMLPGKWVLMPRFWHLDELLKTYLWSFVPAIFCELQNMPVSAIHYYPALKRRWSLHCAIYSLTVSVFFFKVFLCYSFIIILMCSSGSVASGLKLITNFKNTVHLWLKMHFCAKACEYHLSSHLGFPSPPWVPPLARCAGCGGVCRSSVCSQPCTSRFSLPPRFGFQCWFSCTSAIFFSSSTPSIKMLIF